MATIQANTNSRLLAAVMFADIAGYTALMQENEEHAVAIRSLLRKTLEKQVPAFGGTIAQYYGDGALSIFPSICNAVKCAENLQELLQKQSVPIRIGIHMGDVAVSPEGVYGDAVNLAARIESLAMPGSVFVSQKVVDELTNHPEIKTKSIGTFQLKNVRKPVAIYAIGGRGRIDGVSEIKSTIQQKLFRSTCLELVKPFIANVNQGLVN